VYFVPAYWASRDLLRYTHTHTRAPAHAQSDRDVSYTHTHTLTHSLFSLLMRGSSDTMQPTQCHGMCFGVCRL
jgi:hypothetical protein